MLLATDSRPLRKESLGLPGLSLHSPARRSIEATRHPGPGGLPTILREAYHSMGIHVELATCT